MSLVEEIRKIVNKFRNNESITEDLIHYFSDKNFENEIIKESSDKIYHSVYSLPREDQALVVVALSVIALRYSDGKTLWPHIEELFPVYRYERERKKARDRITESMQRYFNDRYPKKNGKRAESNPSKYVSVPLISAGITHHWLPSFFDFCLAIYKINLFSDRDIKYKDLETELARIFKKIQTNINIDSLETDSDASNQIRVSKTKSYKLSKYTQCALLTDNNIMGIAHIGATCINYVIKYLNGENFSVHPFYTDAFNEWKNKLDDKERKKYDTNGSRRILMRYMNGNIYLITKNELISEECNPNQIEFQLLQNGNVSFTSKNIGIDKEEEAIGGGYIIRSKAWPININVLDNISYRYIDGSGNVLFDSKDILYRNEPVLFFDENGNRIYSGSDYYGKLLVISKNPISLNESKIIKKNEYCYISEISVSPSRIFQIDGKNYVFKTIRNVGLDDIEIVNVRMKHLLDNRYIKIYKTLPSITIETSTKKDDLLLDVDGTKLQITKEQIIEYPPLENGISQFRISIPNLNNGFHRISVYSKRTNAIVNNAKYELMYDSSFSVSITENSDSYTINVASSFANANKRLQLGQTQVVFKCDIPGAGPCDILVNPMITAISYDKNEWVPANGRINYRQFNRGNPILYIVGSNKMVMTTDCTDVDFKLLKSRDVPGLYEVNIGPLLDLKQSVKCRCVRIYIYNNDEVKNIFYLDLVTYVDLSKSKFEYNPQNDTNTFSFSYNSSKQITCEIVDLVSNIIVYGPISINADSEFNTNNLHAFNPYKIILKEKGDGLFDSEIVICDIDYSFANTKELIGRVLRIDKIVFSGRDDIEIVKTAYTAVTIKFVNVNKNDPSTYVGTLKHVYHTGRDEYDNLGLIKIRVDGEFCDGKIWLYLSDLKVDELLFYNKQKSQIHFSTDINSETHNMPVVSRILAKYN